MRPAGSQAQWLIHELRRGAGPICHQKRSCRQLSRQIQKNRMLMGRQRNRTATHASKRHEVMRSLRQPALRSAQYECLIWQAGAAALVTARKAASAAPEPENSEQKLSEPPAGTHNCGSSEPEAAAFTHREAQLKGSVGTSAASCSITAASGNCKCSAVLLACEAPDQRRGLRLSLDFTGCLFNEPLALQAGTGTTATSAQCSSLSISRSAYKENAMAHGTTLPSAMAQQFPALRCVQCTPYPVQESNSQAVKWPVCHICRSGKYIDT